MRSFVLLGLFACVTAACGDDGGGSPDAAGNRPPPRVIPGGGIGDGAIDGVVNLYVIDAATGDPVTGATVRIGSIDGTTDATGLFIAEGVVGPQTVIAKATNMRSEMWIGANGANMTLALESATTPTPTKANISGSITGFSGITVPQGHNKTAIVSYSHDDKLGDAANNIETFLNQNICTTNQAAGSCTFTVTTRTGAVALIAAIYDHDTKGTPAGTDDTFTLIGWAAKTDLNVQNGVDQTGVALTMVDVGNLENVTVSFGSPPSGMPNVAGIVGIEVGAAGTLQLLPQILTPTTTTVLAPKLAAFPGSTYRFTAFANNGDTATSTSSAKLLRGLTTTALDAGTWLGLASSLTISRTGATWTPVAGALVHGIEYELTNETQLLNVTAFDGSTSFTLPDILTLPSGTLIGRATALMGTIDLTSFSLETDIAKVTGFSAQPVQID
jgi:hypothetical protein